ncbi:hypothetical protein G6011_04472 [Alternaria panax]|uniref:Uncharacterized protein n=1 Tax=Alternaria panax TaxID=48097 RepID=A0AAD4NTY0_9PLEO|nr:hypothetical protein G6011_04472 [Alternaria panax]
MPYLLQPSAHSDDACNPLLAYTLADPTPSELSKLQQLQDWGWKVSVHFHDDAEYLKAMAETEKAIKKRRRGTQMMYGNMVGDGPRLTFEEVWEPGSAKKITQGLSGMEREEEEDVQAVNEQTPLPILSKLEDSKNTDDYVYRESADSPITRRRTNSTSHFIEEDEANWHALASLHSFQRAHSQPADQETPQSSTSSKPTASSEVSDLPVDPYMLVMATCGHWSQFVAPRAELSSKDLGEPRKLQKKVTCRNSEPSMSYLLPPRFVRPLFCVKKERSERIRGDANLIAPEEQQCEDSGEVKGPPDTISQRSTLQPFRPSPSTTYPDSSPDTLQPTTSTELYSSLHLHLNTSIICQPESRNISPTPSTVSSLIFPGRKITQKEYFRRTNRPRENLQPRQLTPPPGLEVENDP